MCARARTHLLVQIIDNDNGCKLPRYFFFIIEPTRRTNFTNLFCHATLHVSDSSSVYHQEFIHCTLSNGLCHTEISQTCKKFWCVCVCVCAHTHTHTHTHIYIQGEHKVFPWLQTFITGKLRGIQTFFLNVTQLKKFFYNTLVHFNIRSVCYTEIV